MTKLKPAFILLLLSFFVRLQAKEFGIRNFDSNHGYLLVGQYDICWIGKINKTIPVFLHYSLQNKVIIGEIVYLNTRQKKPIKLLGKIEEDKSYRLLEFEPNGNIAGIITGTFAKKVAQGKWFSPKTQKEFEVALSSKDTLIETSNHTANSNELFGSYHYQYSQGGYVGDFEIKRLKNNRALFSIVSLTSAPARNIADVPSDTILFSGNTFTYNIPDSDSCEFKVTFYKDFVNIDYTKGYCSGQFGMNATVDGIYLKIR